MVDIRMDFKPRGAVCIPDVACGAENVAGRRIPEALP